MDDEVGYTLGCPVKCPDSLVKEIKHFKMLGPEHYARYQRFAAEEYVLQLGGSLCPQPGCGAGNLPDDEDARSNRRVVCLECKFAYCKLCHSGFHLGDCQEEEEAKEGSSNPDNLSSWLTIKMSTKPCPECRTPTERDGGCMHMVCSKCKLEWCWVCQV